MITLAPRFSHVLVRCNRTGGETIPFLLGWIIPQNCLPLKIFFNKNADSCITHRKEKGQSNFVIF